MKNRLSHFLESRKVYEVLEEIKARHRNGYEGLLKNIITQIKNYFEQNQYPKLIIGLSGGIDSTLTTYLATLAVGEKNVIGVNLSARADDESVKKAKLVAKSLNLTNFFLIKIEDIVKTAIKKINEIEKKEIKIQLDEKKQDLKDKIRIGNLASRTRVAILYDISKAVNGRLLGTGNKTELFQGYAAKYGTPFSCDLGILNELYKIDIYQLANLLKVPKEIINSIPSTGYYKGQSHEEELGATLEELDAIVYLLFEKKLSPEEVIKKYNVKKEFVYTTLNRYKNAQHKLNLLQYIRII